MTITPPPGPNDTQRGFGMDPRLGAVLATSREDSRPHAILKLHLPITLDYRDRHRLLISHMAVLYMTLCLQKRVPDVFLRIFPRLRQSSL